MITFIIGTRPQIIKHAPLQKAIDERGIPSRLVHTGQHYDFEMDGRFFEDFNLRPPDVNLQIGSGPHGEQTGRMLQAIEAELMQTKPELVVVYGDTNSTVAGALAASKLHLPVAHVEAGLRSFDRSMPEEINRLITDQLSDLLFVPSQQAMSNLRAEGIIEGIYCVGDIMYDATLLATNTPDPSSILDTHRLHCGEYIYATVHRPSNTDHRDRLTAIFNHLSALEQPAVVPLHPRTRNMMTEFGIEVGSNVTLLEPQAYRENLILLKKASCVITDSGGLQKEAYYLKTPCVTLRSTTEWTETVDAGWNRLADPMETDLKSVVKGLKPPDQHPEMYGNGTTAIRIADHLERHLSR